MPETIPKQKPLTVDYDTLEMWCCNTGREPFVSAFRSAQRYRREGKECSIVWKSSNVISVIPISPVFRSRSRN